MVLRRGGWVRARLHASHRQGPSPGLGPDRALLALPRLIAAVVGALGLGSWLVLAAAHRDDLYRVGFVSGAWLELVRSAAHGLLYPPLFDGRYFGGTRYMPLTILLMSGLTKITHDELLAARLVTDASAVAVALIVYSILRVARVPVAVRLLLIGALAITLADDTLTVHGDLLSVGLQLGALALVARSLSTPSVTGAGLLCALALFAKLNALWAPVAILVWLSLHARRQLRSFAAAFAVPLALLVAATDIATHGRFLTNLRELAGAGRVGTGLTLRYLAGVEGSPFDRALGYLGPTGIVLVALASLHIAFAVARRRLTIYDIAFPAAAATLWVTLLDRGATQNHLVDMVTLAAICAGLLAGEGGLFSGRDRQAVELLAIVLVVLTSVVTYQRSTRFAATDALHVLTGRTYSHTVSNLRELVPARGEILSEDPTIPFAADQRPVILDPFMLRRIGERHPAWRDSLIARIQRHDFSRIYLIGPINASSQGWYRYFNLGTPVADAIQRSYSYVGTVDGYAKYVPRA